MKTKLLIGVVALTCWMSASLAAPPVVKTVLAIANNPLAPRLICNGKAVTLMGTCDQVGASIQWSWDFGDGTPAAVGTVFNRYAIEALHTYNGITNQTYTATLTVKNTATGETASKQCYLQILPRSLMVEAGIAIDEGLWYLHKSQNPYDNYGLAFGDWTASSPYWGISALNVNAFEVRGYSETGIDADPYTETVQRGLRFLFTCLTSFAIAPTFDSNMNGVGLKAMQDHAWYETGMYMDAIVASGSNYNARVQCGPLSGRTYQSVVQDMVDAYYWDQTSGGWRYEDHQGPDNSACQWAAIGMIPAERVWNCIVPTSLKQANIGWLAYSQGAGGDFGYASKGGGSVACTAAGLVQLAMDGVGRGDAMWDLTEGYLHDHFCDSGSSSLRTFYYGMFSFVKSMLYHNFNGVSPWNNSANAPITFLRSQNPASPPIDWYGAQSGQGTPPAPCDGVARVLINDQNPAGYWSGKDPWSVAYPMETAMAIMMLSKGIQRVPVAVARAIPNPAVVGTPLALDGSGSYHTAAPDHRIIKWAWDVNNDGNYDVFGSLPPPVTFTNVGTYAIRLLVTDDVGQTADTTLSVRVVPPPVAPTANAGRFYVFCPNTIPWYLNGNGSSNPDEGRCAACDGSTNSCIGDTITAYDWDLGGANTFNDAHGPNPDVTAYFQSKGPGTYFVQLRVTDRTALAYPCSGSPNLTDIDRAEVHVLGATNLNCGCVPIVAVDTTNAAQAKVHWVTNTTANSYNIYRGTNGTGPFAFVGSSTADNFIDTTVAPCTAYNYVVRAVALNGYELCQSDPFHIPNVYFADRLTLITNPPAAGSLTGFTNGHLLEFCQTNELIAYVDAVDGWHFTNWTWGTNIKCLVLLSNGQDVWFPMSSNLILQANYFELIPPKLAITNPTPSGIHLTNVTVVDINGSATDNDLVTNVSVMINGNSSSVRPQTTNGWASWVVPQQQLNGGSNWIWASAVDRSGNITNVTNIVVVDFYASLTLVTNPPSGGSVIGPASGRSFKIGTTFTVDGAPNISGGWRFSNWTGGTNANLPVVLSTNENYTATMASNLLLQANFSNVFSPKVTITNPTNAPSGVHITNALVDVRGTASDVDLVTNVSVRINFTNTYLYAQTTNNWTNWVLPQQLLPPGTNWLFASATNRSGNFAQATNLVFVDILGPLTVLTNPPTAGTITGITSGQVLQFAQPYSNVVATAAKGWSFTNWTGGTSPGVMAVLTNNTNLYFTMVSNLTVQANFYETQAPSLAITNPFPSGIHLSNISVVDIKGWASDNDLVTNVSVQINGSAPPVPAQTANKWTNWVLPQQQLAPGTNWLIASAADRSGNLALVTNLVVVDLWGPLTLLTNPPAGGSVTGAVSGQMLQINKGYTLNAAPTPANGWYFTNWTGGANPGPLPILTNNPNLQFTMVSNLILQANFASPQPPRVVITNPAPSGVHVSNFLVNIQGSTVANDRVTNVWVQINSSGTNTPAQTSNGYTNWVVSQQLLNPGTNWIFAQAADGSGNASAIVSNQVILDAWGRLTLFTSPPAGGSINGATNGQFLPLGGSYTLNATENPLNRWSFTNWTGGTNPSALRVLASTRSFQFPMAPNLILQANFIDLVPPMLDITNPAPGIHPTNALVTLAGWASDNDRVTNVSVQINPAGGYLQAQTTNAWANWVLPPQWLNPGTNWIFAKAVDASGNVSALASNQVIVDLWVPLTLGTNPPVGGGVTGLTNGQLLKIGSSYTVSATANNLDGWWFSNWTGGTNQSGLGVLSTGPNLQFNMVSNLVLQANFTDVLIPTLTGAVGPNGTYILNWPALAGAYQLQFTTKLGGTWQPVAEQPVFVGGLLDGQNFLTNQAAPGSTARFYRLIKQ